MAIPRKLRSRTSWTIGGALILLSAWFVIPAIGQRVAVSEVTPRPVTPRGDLGADEKSTIDLFQKTIGRIGLNRFAVAPKPSVHALSAQVAFSTR
jgi:hypothetical protein